MSSAPLVAWSFALPSGIATRHGMPAADAGARGGAGRGRGDAKVLLWDSKAMRFTNDEQANSLIDTPYRKEWDFKV